MNVRIENFYSLKNVTIELDKGISVLAGKNGAGKTQLLAAINSVSRKGQHGLTQQGFRNEKPSKDTVIDISPIPPTVLWRPAVRKIGEEGRDQEFIPLANYSGFANRSQGHGYSNNIDPRFSQLHHRLCNLFIAGTIRDAKTEHAELWEKLTRSFERVFDRKLGGAYDIEGQGAKVGLLLDDGDVSRFAMLSSGEREYISLLSDIITEPEVDVFLIDEIDVHFHPDLQARVLDELKQYCQNQIFLVSTQSPAVMLATDPERLFFIRHHSEVQPGENQVTRVVDDFDLIESMSGMYAGFGSDIRLMKHYQELANQEILHYAQECTRKSNVSGSEDARDSDPQVSSLRAALLGLEEGATIVEHGVGKGRLLWALKNIDAERVATLRYIAVDTNPEHEAAVFECYEALGCKLKEFKFQTVPPTDVTADLTILANVLHEVPAEEMATFLSRVLGNAKNGSTILILEALELAVGERAFVVYDGHAVKAMFSRCIEAGAVSLATATPASFGGTPLLEVHLTVKDASRAKIDDSDVCRALEMTVGRGSREYANSLKSKTKLSPRSLAFRCHNIANAAAFLRMLE